MTEPGRQPDPVIAPGTVVAVTGATGFIGGRLVERLAEAGAHVTCLIRGADAGTRLHRTGARIRSLDLADADALAAALRGTDVVFHLAYDSRDTAWNFAALRALLRACRAEGCGRLVHVSSFVVYDLPDDGPATEASPRATAAAGYAHTKLALEDELLRAVREQHLPATIIQPTIVYGPGCHPWTIDPADMLRHGTVVLPDAGEGLCNAVYVDDVAEAMLLAAVRPGAIGQRYLVSGFEPITWRRFYEGLAQAIGAKGPQYRPAPALEAACSRGAKLRRLAADPERALRGLLGIRPAGRLARRALRVLPGRLRQAADGRLFGSVSRRRGHIHLPNAGHLRFLRSRTVVGIDKARRELGYAPAFSFEDGLAPTGRYLRDSYFRDEP